MPDEVMNADGSFTISAERYEELITAEAWVHALDAAGVDNWEGIDNAHDIMNESIEED